MERKRKRNLAALLTSILMLFAFVSSGLCAKYTMKMGGVLIEPCPWYIPSDYMEKRVAQLSKGAIEINQYKGGVLGGEGSVLEGIIMGTIQGSVLSTGTFGNFIPQANIFQLPFLFKDQDHVFNTLDGPLGQRIKQKFLEKTGVRIIAWIGYPGFRGIFSNVPIKKIQDLKGLKIRVMESEPMIAMYKAYGAIPVAMPFTDVYQGLQQGTIDGSDGPVKSTFEQKFIEVIKYYSVLNELYVVTTICVSDKWFKSLPENYQDIIIQAAMEGQNIQREAIKHQLEDIKKEFLERGKKIFYPDLKPFRSLGRSIYPKFYEQVGKENVEWIMDLGKDVGPYRKVKEQIKGK